MFTLILWNSTIKHIQLLGWYLIWNKQYILYRVVGNNIFNTGWLTINLLRKSIAALWKYFWWSDQAVKSECKQKVSLYSLDCHPDLLHCGSHLIIFICNISPLQHSLRKYKLLFSFGCHTACLSGSLGCLKLLVSFPLSVVGHRSPSPLPAWPSWEPSDLSGLEPDVPSWA
jgi:hypothetical protein